MSELPEYVLERIFDAPRELVWRAWTDPELLQHWYGPGVETIIHEFDLKPGGAWLNESALLRCAIRRKGDPRVRITYLGFRCARGLS